MNYTNAARLREIAAYLNALADSMDAHALPVTRGSADRWLDTARAARRADVSYTTLYRWGRRHGLGELTVSGTWRFSEQRLAEFLEGNARGVEEIEVVEGVGAPMLKGRVYG